MKRLEMQAKKAMLFHCLLDILNGLVGIYHFRTSFSLEPYGKQENDHTVDLLPIRLRDISAQGNWDPN